MIGDSASRMQSLVEGSWQGYIGTRSDTALGATVLQNPSGALLEAARNRSGLSLREIARRAGTSHATLSAYLHGTKTPSLETLVRIVESCGLGVEFSLEVRIRSANGVPRGEELEQVLRLAGQFPASPERAPRFPVFPRRGA
jgi:transcriptional regulator with XRE-family HTH domain